MRVKQYKKYTPLTITWVDIYECCEWNSIKDIVTLGEVKLVQHRGFFIANKNDELRGDWLLLATSLSEDGDAGFVAIPWGVIRKVEKV
jgi:hypothetical protein